MNKGDLLTVYMDGVAMTLCVLGFYNEEYSGEEMVLLAVVSDDNMLHVPLDDLKTILPHKKTLN